MAITNLFEALTTIGLTLDSIWEGEWVGPMLFHSKGGPGLLVVREEDHKEFDDFLQKYPFDPPDSEAVVEFATAIVKKMAARHGEIQKLIDQVAKEENK